MIPLQITANLANSIAVTDSLSPAIEGIIEYAIREEKGLLDPNPNNPTTIDLPLQLNSAGYYHCSSPFYYYNQETQTRYRKRWDYQEQHLDWGKKKAKFSNSEGQFKAYDLPLFIRILSRIDWYVVGQPEPIRKALGAITHLGKKRSQGHGLVLSWYVEPIDCDYSIWGTQQQLMRPIPLELHPQPLPNDLATVAWKTPSWHPESQSICWIPKDNVKRRVARPVLKTHA